MDSKTKPKASKWVISFDYELRNSNRKQSMDVVTRCPIPKLVSEFNAGKIHVKFLRLTAVRKATPYDENCNASWDD